MLVVTQQRIAKTPSDTGSGSGTSMMPIHYHYDSEGRLISETDGDTGATQREYIWLGLTPVAIYDAANDNDTCDETLLATLQERLLARQDRLALVTERITIVSGNLDTRTAREATVAARKAELEATLAGVNPNNTARIARLTERIATLETRLETIGGAIIRLTDRLETLNARVVTLNAAITRISARIARVQGRCDAGGGTPTSTAQIYYLHADHLGRPAFAMDGAGSVVWDGGITTPFGESIATAAAFAQNLMFPGQYQDAETGLSHNWHRTYDPTLGRYLQSDPIGLAGGLNRYAYVGGNPMGWIDFEGLRFKKDGKIGRGNLTIAPGGQVDAWIADVIPQNAGDPDVVCGCGNPPENIDMDLDFFSHNGQWWKIKHGDVLITPNFPLNSSRNRSGIGLGRIFPGTMYHPDKPPFLWKLKDKNVALEYVNNITDHTKDRKCINLPGLPIGSPNSIGLRGRYKF